MSSSSSGTPVGNQFHQNQNIYHQNYQTQSQQQIRYGNPLSVQSVPSPAPINSPLVQHSSSIGQQQTPLAPPSMNPSSYQSINSPMQQSLNQTNSNYQHNLNSPITGQIQQHIQSPMMPQSVQSQHNIYSPMPNNPSNQLNSNINSPITHSSSQYQSIQSPMPNQFHQNSPMPPTQSPIMTAQSQQTPYQSMMNSPLPPLTPQQQYHQHHQQLHHSSSSIPSTPTNQSMMVNSPYNNQYHHHQHHQQQQQHIHNQYDMPHQMPPYNNHLIHNQYSSMQSNQFNDQNQPNSLNQNYMEIDNNYNYQQQQLILKQQREQELEKEREKEKEIYEKQQRKRFLVELEFVQCLANPNYLHYLAKEGMFDNDSFKNYLKYLLYWKKPEYIQYIKYPECLFFLELIQHDELQQMIKDKKCVHFICEQQMSHWRHSQNLLKNDQDKEQEITEEKKFNSQKETIESGNVNESVLMKENEIIKIEADNKLNTKPITIDESLNSGNNPKNEDVIIKQIKKSLSSEQSKSKPNTTVSKQVNNYNKLSKTSSSSNSTSINSSKNKTQNNSINKLNNLKQSAKS